MSMKDEKGQLVNYIQFAKEIREIYYLEGKVTITDILILLWLYLLTNPFNGYAVISYELLEKELGGFVTKVYLRKILCKLKRLKLVWLKNNKGSKKPFKVWVFEYQRSDKKINDLETIERLETHPSKSLNGSQAREQLSSPIHTLDYRDTQINKDVNSFLEEPSFTSPQNETKKEKENELIQNNLLGKPTPIGEILEKKVETHREKMSKAWAETGSSLKPPLK